MPQFAFYTLKSSQDEAIHQAIQVMGIEIDDLKRGSTITSIP
jgi:hypothetical protein